VGVGDILPPPPRVRRVLLVVAWFFAREEREQGVRTWADRGATLGLTYQTGLKTSEEGEP